MRAVEIRLFFQKLPLVDVVVTMGTIAGWALDILSMMVEGLMMDEGHCV